METQCENEERRIKGGKKVEKGRKEEERYKKEVRK